MFVSVCDSHLLVYLSAARREASLVAAITSNPFKITVLQTLKAACHFHNSCGFAVLPSLITMVSLYVNSQIVSSTVYSKYPRRLCDLLVFNSLFNFGPLAAS